MYTRIGYLIVFLTAFCIGYVSSQAAVQSDNVTMERPESSFICEISTDRRTISWTTADLTVERPENETQRIFTSLAEQDFDAMLKVVPELAKCEYTREFRVASLVGNLLTFEDNREVITVSKRNNYASLGQQIQFKTIDITGKVSDNKRIKLTDYFGEKEILRGLLNHPDIRSAWVEQKSERLPVSLQEFVSGVSSGGLMFKGYRYEIYEDFLSEFVFEEVKDDKVKVKLMFPNTQSKDFDHIGISFYLTIPLKLRESLHLAAEEKAGFLEKDAENYSNGKITKISFSCGK
jgi:hypothetical protein